jgi:hypothetical protein
MIITGESRSDWRKCARRIMRGGKDVSARLVEVVGLAGNDIPYAFQQMHTMALATRCENFFYHATLNPRAHELLTEAHWEQAVDLLGRNLGLTDHSRFVVERVQHGRIHRQVVWSRISHELKAVPCSFSWPIHQKTAQELEERFGHEPTPRRRQRGKAATTVTTSDAPKESGGHKRFAIEQTGELYFRNNAPPQPEFER